MTIDCGCCPTGQSRCYETPGGVGLAVAVVCAGPVLRWHDAITSDEIVAPVFVDCASADFAPGNVIDLNFVDAGGFRADFVAARDFIEAGFLSNPMLFAGTDKVTVDVDIHNDPPFDGVPGGVVGSAGPSTFRPDGTTLTGAMEFEEAWMGSQTPAARQSTIRHELLHVLQIGTGPNWTPLTVNPNTNLWGFTGPQALAEYQTMAGGHPAAVAIPLEWNTGSAGSDGGHWDTVDVAQAPGSAPNGYGQDCMDHELMSYRASGSNTFSRVTAAALRDVGWDYDVNQGAALACGGA